MHTRLYRSTSDQMIAGVCGGLARYLQLETTLVRLFFALLALGDGVGILLYVILWLVMPREEQPAAAFNEQVRAGAEEIAAQAREMGADLQQAASHPSPQAGMLAGAALIIVGSIILVDNLNLPGLGWVSFSTLWPLLLIGGGLLLLLRKADAPEL